jgi:hypothetical protein
VTVPAKSAKPVKVAVVGAHLSGQPLNGQLAERNAKLIETARTGLGYRLYALANTSPPKPGLVFDGGGPGAIEVEIWEMDEQVLRVVRGADPGTFKYRHRDARRRPNGEMLSLRGPRDTRGGRHHRLRRLEGLAQPFNCRLALGSNWRRRPFTRPRDRH